MNDNADELTRCYRPRNTIRAALQISFFWRLALRELHPQLLGLREHFTEASELARALLHGVTPEQTTLRIELNRWSIAECLVHLNLTGEAFVTVISEACEQGQKEGIFGEGPFKKDMRGALRRWVTIPPAKVKFRTREQFEPSRIGPVEDVLTTFLTLQEQFENLVAGADGLDLNKLTVLPPGSKYFRCNLFSCFEIVLAHELRHFWQAEHVKQTLLDSQNRFTNV